MKLASSIRFGGQLVDAADCDYQDYKALQLLCPACKQPVFLQGDSLRNLKDKTISIPAHFKHFPFVDPALVADCEARVAKYDQKEITKRAAIARNQRLKVFQKYFWQLFINNSVCFYGKKDDALRPWHIEESIKNFLQPNNVVIFQKHCFKEQEEADIFYTKYIEEYKFNDYLDNLLRSKKETKRFISREIENPDYISDIKRKEYLSTKINIDFHLHILDEIVDFLHVRSSRYLRLNCLLFGFFVAFSSKHGSDWFKRQIIGGFPLAQVCLASFVSELVKINWGEILQNPNKYIKFDTANYNRIIKDFYEKKEISVYNADDFKWGCTYGKGDLAKGIENITLNECFDFTKESIVIDIKKVLIIKTKYIIQLKLFPLKKYK